MCFRELPSSPPRGVRVDGWGAIWEEMPEEEQKDNLGASQLWLGLPLWLSWEKKSACNVGDLGSVLGLGRSSGEEKGYPLQYSSLEKSTGLYSPWVHKESDATE